ncbi:hypothetical protein B0H13DRAFT_1852142 [Mycena leptocephala]|nr:hypothetical protein B0H13DRAFT_1852142 [Mycena leptocephala]
MVKEGQNHCQNNVSLVNLNPPLLNTWCLGITYTNCAWIVHSDTLVFMDLTHASVQFYPWECWDKLICNVTRTHSRPSSSSSSNPAWGAQIFIVFNCYTVRNESGLW